MQTQNGDLFWIDKSPYLFTNLLDYQFKHPSTNDLDTPFYEQSGAYLSNDTTFLSFLQNKRSAYNHNNTNHCFALRMYYYTVRRKCKCGLKKVSYYTDFGVSVTGVIQHLNWSNNIVCIYNKKRNYLINYFRGCLSNVQIENV